MQTHHTVWFRIYMLSGQRKIKAQIAYFGVNLVARPSLSSGSHFPLANLSAPALGRWVLTRVCSVPNITAAESEGMAEASLC